MQLRETKPLTSLSGEIIVCVAVPPLYANSSFSITSRLLRNIVAGPGNKFLNEVTMDAGVFFSSCSVLPKQYIPNFHWQNMRDGALLPLHSVKLFPFDGENK
ncbi:hypothetical protein XENOCAPTIV_019530 [Xenoophorus captivus]|uniref:Uncharacterized protein n=1 Tax=Xenoophorus captivus TaxID=1517983 RepID=A0ABV0QDR6_9TELE